MFSVDVSVVDEKQKEDCTAQSHRQPQHSPMSPHFRGIQWAFLRTENKTMKLSCSHFFSSYSVFHQDN